MKFSVNRSIVIPLKDQPRTVSDLEVVSILVIDKEVYVETKENDITFIRRAHLTYDFIMANPSFFSQI